MTERFGSTRLADMAVAMLCVLSVPIMWVRLQLAGSAAYVEVDQNSVDLDLEAGGGKAEGSFNLLNTGGGQAVVRLKATCNCTILSRVSTIVPPFSAIPVEFKVSGSPGQRRKQIGHIQVIDDANGSVVAQVELRIRTQERSLVVTPPEVDLRYSANRTFTAEVYVVSLKPLELTCASSTPELEVTLTRKGTRHWRLSGTMLSAPGARSAEVRIVDGHGIERCRLPVRLPAQVIGDVRVAWGRAAEAQVDSAWVLFDPYYGPRDPGAPQVEAVNAVIGRTEEAPGGGLWVEIRQHSGMKGDLHLRVGGEECRLTRPLALESICR